jgi:hypothetical protein
MIFVVSGAADTEPVNNAAITDTIGHMAAGTVASTVIRFEIVSSSLCHKSLTDQNRPRLF